MSVRVHRVKKIEYEESFSWHHPAWDDLIDLEDLDTECRGLTTLSVSQLEDWVQKALTEGYPDVKGIQMIEDDIVWADDRGQDFITYYCF